MGLNEFRLLCSGIEDAVEGTILLVLSETLASKEYE